MKEGMKVRIHCEWHEKHGMEGVITAIFVNGAMIVFPDGMGTVVKSSHLIPVFEDV